MKVAGSSWTAWRLICCFVILYVVHVLGTSKNVKQDCSPSNSVREWDHRDNLIEELATVSDERGKMSGLLSELMEPYDATPFWYNLVQAISLASGITPTTEFLMHDLVTSSFQSDYLNTSLKTVLSLIECDANQLIENVPLDKVPSETFDQTTNDDLTSNGDDTTLYAAKESAAQLLQEEGIASEVRRWAREQEALGNALLDSNDRVRRELRDRPVVQPDLHQPFFMSENMPSSLVTRDPNPNIIAARGCPSGHFEDLRGMCRQTFQYTVNYGGANGAGAARPPWLQNIPHVRQRQRPQQSTIRDLIKDSSFFKHSVQRGYVPPFIFSGQVGNPRVRRPLRRFNSALRPRFQSPSKTFVNSDTEAGTNSQQPPVEVMVSQPMIVVMGEISEPPTAGAPLVPQPAKLPQPNFVPQPALVPQPILIHQPVIVPRPVPRKVIPQPVPQSVSTPVPQRKSQPVPQTDTKASKGKSDRKGNDDKGSESSSESFDTPNLYDNKSHNPKDIYRTKSKSSSDDDD